MPTDPSNPNRLVKEGSLRRFKKRMFGEPLSESVASEWPELQKRWAGMELEMPSETMATGKVRPTNWLENILKPNAHAITWPWKTIGLNRELIEQNKLDLGDILAHELTHIGQREKSGLLKTIGETLLANPEYLSRPYEQEAFEAELNRPIRRGDIFLSPDIPKSWTRVNGRSR